ncbi:Gypsy retrotransposon integrase-like protein 1 [Marasmius crinis-equi]|uniref:Gypsy retrotransposon integrase-like protein 1 n=1 Tax=Marasmius crinis-equi TaxID=585013 RepID=A0ABR3EPE7_9AGAR
MSSDDENYDGAQAKKRRVQRACDVCRRKKIRCDGVQMPGNKCSSCLAYDLECTYMEAAKKRGPPKAYVEGLENRLEKMEKLLRQLMPDDDYNREIGPLSNASTPREIIPQSPSSLPAVQLTSATMMDSAIDAIRRRDQTPPETKENLEAQQAETEELLLSDNMKKMSISSKSLFRFYGKSSSAMFIQRAIDLKEEFTGSSTNLLPLLQGRKRPEFWHSTTWELDFVQKAQPPSYVFPEQDLLDELVQLYFKHINLFIPLLHKPTFCRQLEEKLHLREEGFAAVVLLVCANASRYSNDPRVRLDGVDSWLSSGWKWFDQVQLVRKSLLSPPSLYDLQFYCGSSVPHACWTMVGMGIRLAQDIGAHRRKVSGHMTVEDELMKRAFWTMVLTDYSISAAYGRPCGIQEEDFDLDLPIECDDEYWEHPDPEQAWRQPAGKPSTISYFVSLLKLTKLLALALRTIYSINKSKILLGFVGPQWEQRIVTELDSALNQWVDSVPEHLRWDPNRDDEVFFKQSAGLYTEYYLLQILIHRPFIPSPKKPSPLSFPSLAICTNAARSCSHIADIQRKRTGTLLPFSMGAVFSCGIILLLNIWGGKRSGLSADPAKEMADVHKCMEALRAIENRWHAAGRLWDVLYELASVGELPLPQGSPPASNKRERDADSPISAKPLEGGPQSLDHEHRSIAGSKRAMKSGNSPKSTQQHLSSLPMYSDELGRLPVHGQLGYTNQDDWAQLGANAGYWFTQMGGVPMNGIGTGASVVEGSVGSAGAGGAGMDTDFPMDFPTLADAEFFNQLASIGWTTGRMGSPNDHSIFGGMNGEVGDRNGLSLGVDHLEQQRTQTATPGGFGSLSAWPDTSPPFGPNTMGQAWGHGAM